MRKPRKTAQKEHLAWMRENGYTEKQMDEFWEQNRDTNFVIRNLTTNGYSWRDMNLEVVKKLPTQKERDLEYLRKKEEEEKRAEEAKKKDEERRLYYQEHFEEIMCEKIDTNQPLVEEELKRLVWEYEVERSYGDDNRWTRGVASIIKLCGRTFMLYWQKGLTEMQDDFYNDQPYEVEKITYEKTITVTEWREVGAKEGESDYVDVHSKEN